MKKQGELHAGVFGVVTGGQFLLGLWHIERSAVDFGQGGDQENDRSDRLEHRKPERAYLRFNDFDHAQRTGQQDHPTNDSPRASS